MVDVVVMIVLVGVVSGGVVVAFEGGFVHVIIS